MLCCAMLGRDLSLGFQLRVSLSVVPGVAVLRWAVMCCAVVLGSL